MSPRSSCSNHQPCAPVAHEPPEIEPGWEENWSDNRRGSRLATFLCQALQLVHELGDVFELSLHGRKSNVGDLVQLMQFLHHFFPDDPAFDLRLTHLLNMLFNAIGHGLNGTDADRAFFASLF